MKKIKAIITIEIDDAKEFRNAMKIEGYDNEIDFLNDYFYPDQQDFVDFDFEIKKIKFEKTEGKE
jgi:hypothetical protein